MWLRRGIHTEGFYPRRWMSKTLKEIFELASWAPSNCNVQPWHVHVVSGDACNRMREKMKAAARKSPAAIRIFPGRASLAVTIVSARSALHWVCGSIRVSPGKIAKSAPGRGCATLNSSMRRILPLSLLPMNFPRLCVLAGDTGCMHRP